MKSKLRLPKRSNNSASVLLAFGANLGDPAITFRRCLEELNKLPGTQVIRFSTLIQTEPVGGPPNQPMYKNGAILISTQYSPEELLLQTQAIENALGRIRTVRNGPRTCDLDILLYDDLTWSSPTLIIPHPRMYQRDFVLIPAQEILAQEGEAREQSRDT